MSLSRRTQWVQNQPLARHAQHFDIIDKLAEECSPVGVQYNFFTQLSAYLDTYFLVKIKHHTNSKIKKFS
jgi:hypothetical protein